MVNLSGHKEFYKKEFFVQLIFWCVTLVMLITRYASFYTYSGADDLHYAFLSNKLLNGSYDIFFETDIYSGRAVVILYQALWFKLFGINDLSMCMPSLSLLIVLAYVVCFKCSLARNIYTVVLGCAIIYFNPVVSAATLGNLPDVYIALIALVTFLFIKKSTNSYSIQKYIFLGLGTGLLLIAGLFVKESIVLIYVGATAMLFYYRKKTSRSFVISLVTTFSMGVAGYLCFYYIYTGDPFYHFVQIKNSSYFNACSYGCFPTIYLLKRLTITVPYGIIVAGAYPLLLVIPVLFAYKQHTNFNIRFWKIALASLIVLALYFPFSIFPYIPLCHNMRQFFFLFPFAAVLYLSWLQEVSKSGQGFKKINIISSIVFTIVVFINALYTPFNKWGLFCNGLLACIFIINIFLQRKMQRVLLYLTIPVILWLSISYNLYEKPHQGYAALKIMQAKISQDTNYNAQTFYFINNDTKTHFALISQFDTAKQFFNLDTVQLGFKPFIKYQPRDLISPATFQKGWLIVSEHYFENIKAGKMEMIRQQLSKMHPGITVNKTTAYYLTSAETVKKIMDIVNANTDDYGCY